MVVCASPVSEYAAALLPVFATNVVQVEPPSADLSTLYPVMAEPPLSAGAVQLSVTWEEETAVDVSALGGDGATAKVVAEVVLEGELVPTEFIAETL